MASRRNRGYKDEAEPDPATWTNSEEKLFIQIMLKEVQKGNRSSTTFSRKGWKHIEQEFCSKTTKRYNNAQFRNKFNQLRTRYHDFSKLLKEPGFSWDPVLNAVIATDETWESYIKGNKKAKRFRKKGCPMFNELGIIYGDETAGFKDVFPLSQYPTFDEDKLEVEDASTNDTQSASPSDSSESKDYTPEGTRRRPRSLTPTSHLRGKKEARIIETGEAFLKEGSESPKEKNLVLNSHEKSFRSDAFSITKCVKCLESIQGVDGNTYLRAINMFKDVDWREMFMAMSAERRLVWLASLQ